MNYYTNLAPASIQKIPQENEAVIIDSYVAKKQVYLFFKRFFDIVFSLIFIVAVLSWLMPVIGVYILLDSAGPVFFVQKRVGRRGKLFSCIKFRTMIINDEADEMQAEENDYRITRAGKFLRRTNIDELPQFFNVLSGSMSIIGPRPHMISDCTRFSFVIPAYKFRNLLRPGITGLAQVKGYHGPTVNYESIFTRYHWDAEYVRKANFFLDLKIILHSFGQSIYNMIGFLFFSNAKKRQGKTVANAA
jgi:putative colanic acid biosynthesis UDP-glucose lipid carrier transferase